MSDLTTLIAISFLFTICFPIMYYIYSLANQLGTQIVAGTIGDSPMPTWFRTRMLFQMWLPYQAGAVAFDAALMLVMWEVANHVSDAGVKTVALLFAFIAGFAATMSLMTVSLGLRQYYRNTLRQAEAD
jgi:hypothetical protein